MFGNVEGKHGVGEFAFMLTERLSGFTVCGPRQEDAVGDLEVGFLSSGLHQSNDLSRHTRLA